MSPQLLFATSAGSIGVVASLSAEAGQVLSGVERNLRAVVQGVGGLAQEECVGCLRCLSLASEALTLRGNRYRAYKSDKESQPFSGFVDGLFVEQFLDLSPEEQDRVIAGRSDPERLALGREEVGRLLEEVARVH